MRTARLSSRSGPRDLHGHLQPAGTWLRTKCSGHLRAMQCHGRAVGQGVARWEPDIPAHEMAFRVVLDVRLKYGSCTAAAVLDEMHF